jgi:hypothetical protein
MSYKTSELKYCAVFLQDKVIGGGLFQRLQYYHNVKVWQNLISYSPGNIIPFKRLHICFYYTL